MPVGLFRDGKKRKRRAAARARAAAAGDTLDIRRARPDPLLTTGVYVASQPRPDASARDDDDEPSTSHAINERF